MKILIIINSLGTGGAEKLLVDTLPKYLEQGIHVELALLNATKHPFYIEFTSRSNCKIHELSLGSVYNPVLIFKIIPLLKKFDVVHVHLFPALYWVGFASFFSSNKTQLVFTEHSTHNRRRSFFFKWIDQFIYKHYKVIIVISEGVKNALQKHLGCDESKFNIIKNGINLELIKEAIPIENSFFPNGDNIKILLQIARFYYPKDHDTLLRTMTLLPNNVKLLLVGDGERLIECKTLAERLGVANKVKFLGVRNDIPQLLKLADIVILSSKYEGLSLSSIEGMASGKPFVASDVPGLKELVNGAGLLFQNGDDTALAKIIMKLLNDKKLYSEISKRCRERAAYYDINNLIDKHIKLYTEIM